MIKSDKGNVELTGDTAELISETIHAILTLKRKLLELSLTSELNVLNANLAKTIKYTSMQEMREEEEE